MKKFDTFCSTFQLPDPFPFTETVLCSFAAYLADQGLSPQTIKSYLAGVRNMQLSLGLPDPRDQSSLPILKRVQAGIWRARLGTTPARVRLPVTLPLLWQLRQYLDTTAHRERVAMWAICCMAFFGYFRLGEVLLESPNSFDQQYHLTWGDVAVDSQTDPRMLRVHLKQSKTDQFHRGADIVVGRMGTDLCPVAAVLSYIASRGPEQGASFLDSQAHPIAKTYFIRKLRKVISALGLPQEQFAGHSFRIRAATSAAMAGLEDSTIQLLGRWSSAAFLRYIRTPPEQLALLSATLASHEANRGEASTNLAQGSKRCTVG